MTIPTEVLVSVLTVIGTVLAGSGVAWLRRRSAVATEWGAIVESYRQVLADADACRQEHQRTAEHLRTATEELGRVRAELEIVTAREREANDRIIKLESAVAELRGRLDAALSIRSSDLVFGEGDAA